MIWQKCVHITVLIGKMTKDKEEMRMFCTNCGKEMEDGVKFCTNCGTPLQSAVRELAKDEETADQVIENYKKRETEVEAKRAEYNRLMSEAVETDKIKLEIVKVHEDIEIMLKNARVRRSVQEPHTSNEYMVQEVTETQNIMKFCPKCGAQLEEIARFCSNCGNQLF